jgi:cyclopropane-fatty-acyl-phospholipid synthase
MAGDKRFRIWHVYLAGSSYAFKHDLISLYQIVCGKAGRSPSALPWSRHYMYQPEK